MGLQAWNVIVMANMSAGDIGWVTGCNKDIAHNIVGMDIRKSFIIMIFCYCNILPLIFPCYFSVLYELFSAVGRQKWPFGTSMK